MKMPAMQENLAHFTKEELRDTAMRLGMPQMKRSAKKAELIEDIAVRMDEHWDNLLVQLRLDEIDALRAHLSKGMIPADNLDGEDGDALYDGMLTLYLNGLQGGRDDLNSVDPRVLEHLQLDEEQRAQKRLEDNLFDYMLGWLVHVGMMPMEELIDRTAALTETTGAELEGVKTLCAVLLLVRDRDIWTYYAEDDRVWTIHRALDDPESLFERLQEPHIAELSWPDFDEDQLAEAGSLGLPGDPKLYVELLGWLEAHHAEDPVGLMADAVFCAQNDAQNEGLELIYSAAPPKDLEEANKAAGLTFNLFNRIPRWSNKGHSPEALFARGRKLLRTVKMPGRNDPCTCGSGRKYKNCCGRRLN